MEFKTGFTWRSILAVCYAIFVYSPALIWMYLAIPGMSILGTISFSTLILAIEIAKISGSPMNKQESTIIFALSSIAGIATFFTGMIYRIYFTQSPIAKELAIVNEIPEWWAPSPIHDIFNRRTFFDPSWTTPIFITLAAVAVSVAGQISWGLLAREVYIEQEKLPFPMQKMSADLIITLSESLKKRLELISFCSILAFAYAIFAYTIPMMVTASGYAFQPIPIPWVDLTRNIEDLGFPGASFGIATDPALMASGIIVPFNIVSSLLIGSAFSFLFMNHFLVRMGWTAWATRWVPHMDLQMIYRESTLTFWASPIIGIGIAAGLIPLIMKPKSFIQGIKSLFQLGTISKSSERISGRLMPRWFTLSLLVSFNLGGIALALLLVPDIPLWIPILAVTIWPMVSTLVSTRMVGLAATEWTVPEFQNLMLYFSGYGKADIWFVPLTMTEGTGLTATFELCRLTETSISSYIKANLLVIPIAIICSFFYTMIFWQLAPIPSGAYPNTQITWPVQAIRAAIWIKRPPQYFIKEWILQAFAITAMITVASQLLHSPIIMVVVAAGIASAIPIPMTMMIGALLGKIIARIKGKEWFNEYKNTIAAGIFLGEGIAVTIGVAIAIVIKASWVTPV